MFKLNIEICLENYILRNFSVFLGFCVLFLFFRLFYLSVQFFHQRDISRYGVDPEVFFRAGVKGEAISHLLAFRVGAVEAVDLCP